MLRLLAGVALIVATSHASFCGDSMIPYSFEVLPDGHPSLGCARPTCFGWTPEGTPISSQQALFYNVMGNADGFARQDRASIPAYGSNELRLGVQQNAICEPAFGSQSCSGFDSWVGGVSPMLNVSAAPLELRCCHYAPLHQSEDRGIATVTGGQIVVGGEVNHDGLQYAFDYISNSEKHINEQGSIYYSISMRRFNCAPLPDDKKPNAAQAFQAAVLPAQQPIPSNQLVNLAPPGQGPVGPPATQTALQPAVLEQVIAEEAVQLPAGTQFQPVASQAFAPPPAPPAPYVPQTQYYQPYYAQTTPFTNGHLCFTGDMLVELADGSTKRMDELKKDDHIMTLGQHSQSLEYSPVLFFMHRVPDQKAEFYEITTESGQTVKLTGQHYIFKSTCMFPGREVPGPTAIEPGMVPTEEVRVGDCIFTVDEERKTREKPVVSIRKVIETGIYAPMTDNGKIVVNGIHASCQAVVPNTSMQTSFFSFAHGVKQWMSSWMSEYTGVDADVIDLPFGYDLLMDMILPKEISMVMSI